MTSQTTADSLRGTSHAPPARSAAAGLSAPGSVKLRRRPRLALLGVLLAVSAALVAGWAVLQAQDTTRVLGVARPVAAGHPISVQDLTYVDVPAGSMPLVIRGGEAGEVLGQYATVGLLPGQLLTRDSVTPFPVPAKGRSLVAVAVDAGRMPTLQLERGDRIAIVSTPSEQDEPPTDEEPESLTATVVSQEAIPDTSTTVINVEVEESRAALLAARAATGRIAVVLQAREP